MTDKNAQISKWIQRSLKESPPRANSLIITIFGDSIAPHGGAAWLGNLIDVLAPFGLDHRLVRTSAFRLSEEGWLESRREGRRSLYSLTSSGLRRFENAYRRIYTLPSKKWEGAWTLVLFPRATITAPERAELRRELEWEGFGLIAPGVFGHPAANATVVNEILKGLRLSDKVFVIAAKDLDGFAARPIRELVQECWTLEELAAGYRNYLTRFEPILELLQSSVAMTTEQAFQIRTLLIHSFRRVTLRDPHFPAEMLPEEWPGHPAYALCRELYRHCYKQAELYVMDKLEGAEGKLPKAASEFYRRFGGLA